MVAKFYGDENGKMPDPQSGRSWMQILKEIESLSSTKCWKCKQGERTKKAAASVHGQVPCSRKRAKHLNFSTQKTMRLAQQLYEGVDIKGSGTVGTHHLSAYRFHPCI